MTITEEAKSWKVWRRQYLSLKAAAADEGLPESVRVLAQAEFDELDSATFTVTIRSCIICKRDYDWRGLTAKQMSEWLDEPRGICGKCG